HIDRYTRNEHCESACTRLCRRRFRCCRYREAFQPRTGTRPLFLRGRDGWISITGFPRAKNSVKGFVKNSTFQLHQAVEHLTTTALLFLTSYKPKGHDIAERLRQCAALDPRFGEVFPMASDADRQRFE